MPHSSPNMHIHPCKHACAMVQPLLCHMQTIWTDVATWVLAKNPSKSTPAHDAVSAALSHRHHLIIHFDTGPIQQANCSPSLYATHRRILFSSIFWQESRDWCIRVSRAIPKHTKNLLTCSASWSSHNFHNSHKVYPLYLLFHHPKSLPWWQSSRHWVMRHTFSHADATKLIEEEKQQLETNASESLR